MLLFNGRIQSTGLENSLTAAELLVLKSERANRKVRDTVPEVNPSTVLASLPPRATGGGRKRVVRAPGALQCLPRQSQGSYFLNGHVVSSSVLLSLACPTQMCLF